MAKAPITINMDEVRKMTVQEMHVFLSDKASWECFNCGHPVGIHGYPFYKCPSKKLIQNIMSKEFQVKRLSDGELFSVGDYASVTDYTRGGWHGEIIDFVTVGGEMVAVFDSWRQPLRHLIKSEPPKPDIFTTEDGVPYYEYQQKNIYCLHTGTSHWHPDKHVSYTKELHVHYNKFFSTKEAAEEYIKMNKPLNISMKEIASCVTDYVYRPYEGHGRKDTRIDLDKLETLINSKL